MIDLKELRNRIRVKGLYQKDISEMLGMSSPAVMSRRMKDGKFTMEQVEKLVNILGIKDIRDVFFRNPGELKKPIELEVWNMDTEAIMIVENYIVEHLDKSDPEPEFEVYIVWKCKALQNWKYLLSSSLFDGMYYELTYNGDKKEWYLDAYKKFENRKIKALEA